MELKGAHDISDCRRMSASRADLQLLLLKMLGVAQPVDVQRLLALTAADWLVIQDMVRDNRIAPMLQWQRQTRGEAWPIPDNVAVNWLGAYRRAALRVLRIEQTILRVNELFDGTNIAYAAIKGAALAWSVYQSPSLRTMRHLDILVGRDDVSRAYDVLRAADFRTPEMIKHAPEFPLLHDKHFPPLFSPVFEINVELHFRLINHVMPGTDMADYHHPERLLARRTTEMIRDRAICVLCPTDTLLHIIVHAAYDHVFADAPLVLHDVALLIAQRPIDWPRFWHMAEQGGWSRGCQLMFQLVEDAQGGLPAEALTASADTLPETIKDQTKLLTLSKTDERQEARIAALSARRRGARERIRYFGAEIFVPRHLGASWGNVERDSVQLLWRYPLRMFYLIRAAIRAVLIQRTVKNADPADIVADWLHTARH